MGVKSASIVPDKYDHLSFLSIYQVLTYQSTVHDMKFLGYILEFLRMGTSIVRTLILDLACLHHLEKLLVLQFLLPHGLNLMESALLHLLLRGHHQK